MDSTDKFMFKCGIWISVFMIIMFVFQFGCNRYVHNNYKYTITKRENDRAFKYYVNEYKIDSHNCLHLLDLDSIIICGNYTIEKN
jgi:hypothetical protein